MMGLGQGISNAPASNMANFGVSMLKFSSFGVRGTWNILKISSWWLSFNPFEKYAKSQNGFIFPTNRGEHKKYLGCHDRVDPHGLDYL